MKKDKLNLEQLKVKSFVTGSHSEDIDTLKGGYTYLCGPGTIPASPLCAYTQVSCYEIHCDRYTVMMP
ncbi:pinensin family lanthipeptide [Fulvivirga imtechensis]|uniref:pinensin family lanthipeptide n=1 Tax=Fulvivirga imtechensis TaxID=881893 RepID=UPI001C873A14